jgi:hypothetical protein
MDDERLHQDTEQELLTESELADSFDDEGQAESQEEEADSLKQELKTKEQKALKKLKAIKENVSEEDSTPVGAQTLRRILGGDILSASLVRRQVWLFILILLFVVFYVAFRYQCQQDTIKIAEMERTLQDAKYKALSSQSTLTERCRESRVLEALRRQNDSLLKVSSHPPYIIEVKK